MSQDSNNKKNIDKNLKLMIISAVVLLVLVFILVKVLHIGRE